MFPVGLPRLLWWAENQKSVPEVLHMAGSMFEARAGAVDVRGRHLELSCACCWSSGWRLSSPCRAAAHHLDFPFVRVIATSGGELCGHRTEAICDRSDRTGQGDRGGRSPRKR